MTRTKKTQPKKKKKLFSQKGSQKGSNKMSAKVKSNKKSLNSKATAFVTPVSLATSAKPAAKPLSAKLRSAKGLSPKGTSVKHKVSPKSTSNKKETVNQFTNDEGGGGGGGQVSTTDDQPALKNAYRKMYGMFLVCKKSFQVTLLTLQTFQLLRESLLSAAHSRLHSAAHRRLGHSLLRPDNRRLCRHWLHHVAAE